AGVGDAQHVAHALGEQLFRDGQSARLGHPGRAPRACVLEHQDAVRAYVQAGIVDPRGEVSGRGEHDRLATVTHQLGRDGGLFDDGAVRREVAAQNGDTALWLERLLQWIHHALRSTPTAAAGRARPQRGRALELFAKRATGDGWLVEVQQATARELLHDGRHTASFVQLLHVEGAARPQVGDERRLARDAIEQV